MGHWEDKKLADVHTHRLVVNISMSKKKAVTSGITQRLAFGPALFNSCFSDTDSGIEDTASLLMTPCFVVQSTP